MKRQLNDWQAIKRSVFTVTLEVKRKTKVLQCCMGMAA